MRESIQVNILKKKKKNQKTRKPVFLMDAKDNKDSKLPAFVSILLTPKDLNIPTSKHLQ